MNKKFLLTGILASLTLSLFSVLPTIVAAGMDSPAGWGTLPLSDASDDVISYTNEFKPWTGTSGDYHNEIDLQLVELDSGGINLYFNETPCFNMSYEYQIYIDSTGDNQYDYIIRWSGSFYLVLINPTPAGNLYWNASSETWTSQPSNLSHGISTGQLAIYDLDTPISNIAISNIGVLTMFKVNWMSPTHYYADYTPTDPSDPGIPAFSLLFVLFSLFMLLGISYLQIKKKYRF
jgi:hypothetical protein